MTELHPVPPLLQTETIQPKPWLRWFIWPFVVLGVLAAIALVWLMVMLLDLGGGSREQPVMARAGDERRFTVGQIEPLEGTSLIAIQISAIDHGGSISKGYGSDQRNLLLLDRNTGQSRRILPDNAKRITGLRYLPDGNAPAPMPGERDREVRSDEDSPTKASRKAARYYVFELADPNRPDKGHDLMVGLLASGKPVPVLRGIDGIDHLEMLNDNRASIIVREKGQLHFKVLDLPASKITEDHLIDIG